MLLRLPSRAQWAGLQTLEKCFFGIKQDYIDISQKELDEIRLWYDNSDLKEVFDKLNEIEKEMNKLKIAKKEIQELLNHTMKEVS